MKAVGIRELKNRLSEYVRMVRGGEEILVTDRGEVVAEIRQPTAGGTPVANPRLVELVKAGKLRLGAPNDPGLYRRLGRLLPEGEALRLLDEARGER